MWTYRVVDGRELGYTETCYIVTKPDGTELSYPWRIREICRAFCRDKNKEMGYGWA